jgi:hypothetical protein
MERIRRDLEPTPGRMNASLRIVLASIITLLFLMTLRMPFASMNVLCFSYLARFVGFFVSVWPVIPPHPCGICCYGPGRCDPDRQRPNGSGAQRRRRFVCRRNIHACEYTSQSCLYVGFYLLHPDSSLGDPYTG